MTYVTCNVDKVQFDYSGHGGIASVCVCVCVCVCLCVCAESRLIMQTVVKRSCDSTYLTNTRVP